MASNIDPTIIDGTYPVEGENNDSQGFRTNFTNTASNFSSAKDEIDELQSKTILKSALTGQPAPDNTLTTPLKTAASTTAAAGLNVAEGSAPTSPEDGDIWVTAGGDFIVRLNGVSVNLSSATAGAFTLDGTNNSFYGGTGAGASLAADGLDNFFAGVNAGGSVTTGDNNIAIGNEAMSAMTSGSGNVALGHDALTGGFGTDNVVIGNNAGNKMTSNSFNVVIGGSAGLSLTSTATYNVIIGNGAMGDNAVSSFGDNNIAIGRNTLENAAITDNAIAIGINALNQNSSGDGNVGIGSGVVGVLGNVTTGTYNTAIGYDAGRYLDLGATKNVTIGYRAGPSNPAGVDEDNQLYIHNDEGTPLIGGDFGTGIVRLSGALRFTERGDHIETPAATFGELWVKNDSPNTLIFTDDTGTDHDLTAGGNVSNTGTPANNQLAVWTNSTTIEGEPDVTFNGGQLLISNNTQENFSINDTGATLASNTDVRMTFQGGGVVRGRLRYSSGDFRMENIEGRIELSPALSSGEEIVELLKGGIQLNERADHAATPLAAHGEIWLKDDAPNSLMFTDDAGTDYIIGGAAASGLPAGGTEGQILVKNSATDGDANWTSYGSIPASATEYFPGYSSYTRVSDTVFTIDLVDAENLFYVGRRVKFDKSGVFDYGVVNAVDFNSTNANDTTVTLTMEGIDTVPTGTFDVALVTSATNWSPIAGDPFSGTAINAIATGVIGATQWWFAVGDGGKVATSSDGGLTWTLRTTVTTEDLNDCTYDPANETFWAGGDAGVLVSSTNGTTMTEDTTSIPALATTGNANIMDIAATNSATSGIQIRYLYSTVYAAAYTTNQGTSWANGDTSVSTPAKPGTLTPVELSAGVFGDATYFASQSNTSSRQFTSITLTDTTGDSLGASNIPTAPVFFWDGTVAARVYGDSDGDIIGFTGWTGDDTITFTQQWNSGAYSTLHDRVVFVGNNQQIGYWDGADSAASNSVTSVSNGFAPTANILGVAWNQTDGVFVAVADNGQICRSTNGTN